MMAGLAAEADDFLTKPFDTVELSARIKSGTRVLDLQASLVAAQEALRHEATHDRLTGLGNRGTILDTLTREIQRSQPASSELGVAVVDIDHFKRVNDTYGHAAGDRVLRETAGRMTGVLRQVDAIGRYGGEEFLVVLPDCAEQSLRRIGERIRTAVCGSPMCIGDAEIEVSVSVGMAWRSIETATAAALIQTADRALYNAKLGGRNRVCIAAAAGTAATSGSEKVATGFQEEPSSLVFDVMT
jgi:diguanylate cyclase (GGDEF)-like protein